MHSSTVRVYFENPVGRVLEHPDGYALVQYQPGPRQLSDLQAFLHHTRQLLRLRNWYKLISEQRRMTPFTEAESQWIVEFWLSPQNQGRDVYGAVLLPPEAYAEIPESSLQQDIKVAALTYRVFDNDEAAIKWLRQCP